MAQMPKTGDRVRVVLEGEVSEIHLRDFLLGKNGESNYIDPTAGHVKSVEVIPKPYVPQPGDVVKDARGKTFVRVTNYPGFAWLENGELGYGNNTHNLEEPLTLVVRDGLVLPR